MKSSAINFEMSANLHYRLMYINVPIKGPFWSNVMIDTLGLVRPM